jgi:hypothetical protein
MAMTQKDLKQNAVATDKQVKDAAKRVLNKYHKTFEKLAKN